VSGARDDASAVRNRPKAFLRPGLLPEPLNFERGAAGRTGARVDPAAVDGPW
jgi:hypothetical protein